MFSLLVAVVRGGSFAHWLHSSLGMGETQAAAVRRAQHMLIRSTKINSQSEGKKGEDPHRSVRVLF